MVKKDMNHYTMDKEQINRLEYLVEAFINDSEDYKHLQVPHGTFEKKRLLRSLMNIRMPKKMRKDSLIIQDEYLKRCAEEKGIVEIEEIEEIKPGISIWQGDITRLHVDGIVNAANSQMLGCFVPMHSCIDNCIHSYAGIQLREECYEKMQWLRFQYGDDYEQPTAIPMMTEAYNLPARKVIHVVGPIVEEKLTKELEHDLEECYVNILDLCLENNLNSVAFCCISTGVFRFPNQRAAEIAVEAVSKWIKNHPGIINKVVFNVFKDEDKKIYEQLLK